MHVLIATNHLEKTGGTECYTFALAQELVKQGHDVEYFTFQKGEISNRIEKLGIKFRSRIFYDIILANHKSIVDHLYKRGFIIQTCHGTVMDLEQPSSKADAYVSISKEVHDYLASKGFQSTIIKNGIDCERFFPQKELNHQLTNVLSLCQSDEANLLIEKACSLIKVNFTKSNKHEENLWDIEKKINQSDLIIGIGRSAYDAMACGRAVISFDIRNYSSNYGDGYLNNSNIENSIHFNCSGRYSKTKFDEKKLANEMLKYDAKDGSFLREFALSELNIKTAVKQYLNIYPQNKKHLIKLKKFFILIARNFYWSIRVTFQKHHCF